MHMGIGLKRWIAVWTLGLLLSGQIAIAQDTESIELSRLGDEYAGEFLRPRVRGRQ